MNKTDYILSGIIGLMIVLIAVINHTSLLDNILMGLYKSIFLGPEV